MIIESSDCYKAVSDLIADSYDWISNQTDGRKVAEYVLGLNDMARYLVEMIEDEELEKEGVDNEVYY